MKYLFLMILFYFSLISTLRAQENQDSLSEYDCVYYIEDEPKFPGGDSARRDFIRNNLIYPDTATYYHVEGTVYATFIVERDGGLSSFRILRGIGAGCDEESLRVLKLMPNWIPAKRRGKPIRVQMNMPIKFKLVDNTCITTKPTFPGGEDSLKEFIRSRINYGKLIREEIHGSDILVSLLIDKQGKIYKTYILHDIGGGSEMEARRIISEMPNWIPAKCDSMYVPSHYLLRMAFVGD